MKKVLVTGGMGFIGSHLCFKMRWLGWEVDIIDLKCGKDMRTCELKGDYDIIFHLAALRSVPDSFDQDREYFDNNIYGSYKVFEAFKDKKIINISTSSASNPIAPYGLTKLMVEYLSKQYDNVINLRLFNPFGEGVYDDVLVIPTFARQMLANEQVYIHSDGEQDRDFTYVVDVVNEILIYGRDGVPGTYTVGYKESVSINKLFDMMSRYYGYKKKPEYLPRRKGDQAHTKSDHKMKANPLVGFEKGLIYTMDWFKKEYENRI